MPFQCGLCEALVSRSLFVGRGDRESVPYMLDKPLEICRSLKGEGDDVRLLRGALETREVIVFFGISELGRLRCKLLVGVYKDES